MVFACCQHGSHLHFAKALHGIEIRSRRRRNVVRQPGSLRLYWDFGTIFEFLAAFFFLLGIVLWTGQSRGWFRVVLASLALLLAMKAKEMAIAMPIIWVTYDLLVRQNMNRRMATHWLLPSGLALLYAVTRADMKGALPGIHITWISASTHS
jgi:hypothetical protein